MAWQTTHPSLLVRVRDPDDHAAWADFDRRYGELIVRYCRGRGLQPSDAEDVRQMVLMNLASAMKSFRYAPERGRFRTYLGRVVRNAVSRWLSRPRRARPGLDLDVEGLPGGDGQDEIDERWEREWVLHHLRLAMQTVRGSFDPRSVEVFDRLLAGATTAQVAREFEMSTQAVHKIKQRIRDRLRALIAAQVAEEEEAGGA